MIKSIQFYEHPTCYCDEQKIVVVEKGRVFQTINSWDE